MKMTKKILAVVLSVIMILSVFAVVPFTAFARDGYLWLYANDANVSLINNYNYGTGSTVGGGSNGSRTQSLSDMQEKGFVDAQNTSNVTYYIYAENAGTYNSLTTVNWGLGTNGVVPEGGYYFVIGVNDKKFYKSESFTTTGWKEEVSIDIELEKGINVVRILPHAADNNNHQYWVDVNSFNLPAGVGLENKTGEFKTNCINGGAGQVQGYTNLFSSVGTNLGGCQGGTMRSEKLTYATMDTEALKNVPYYSVTVNVPYDGYYSILQQIGTPTSQDATGYFAYAVDGKFYRGGFNSYGGGNKTYATAYMTKGTHTITLTAAYDYVGTYNGGVVSNNGSTAFDWNDLQNVYIPGVTRAETQINPQTIAPQTNVLYADDSAWYVGGTVSTTEKAYGTRSSGDHWLIGGFSTNGGTFDDFANGQYKANEASSVNYQVKVDKAGTYDITVINQVATNTTTNAKDSGYFATVAVNDKTFVKAPFTPYYLTQVATNCWTASTVSVELEEGVNVIRVFPKTSDAMTNISGWINFGGIKVDGPGTATAVTSASTGKKSTPSQQVQFGDSTLTNKYLNVTAGGNVGGVQYGDAFAAGITYDTLSLDNLSKVPYVAFNVTVPEAGNYDFQLATSYGPNSTEVKGMPYIAAITSEGVKTKIARHLNGGFVNSPASIKLPAGTTTVYFVPPLSDHYTSVGQWYDFGTLYSYGGATISLVDVYAEEKAAFAEYKTAVSAGLADYADDCVAAADIVATAQSAIAALVYDEAKTLDANKADVDAIKAQAVADVEAAVAAEKLAADKAAFDEYKAAVSAGLNDYADDCAAAADIVATAQADIAALVYDEAKTLDENKADADAIANKAIADVAAAVEAAEKLAADKAAFDEYKATASAGLADYADDCVAAADIVAVAQADIAALVYDEAKTLDENKADADAIANKAVADVAEAVAAELAANKASFDNTKSQATNYLNALNTADLSAAMKELHSEYADRLANLTYDESKNLADNLLQIDYIVLPFESELAAAKKAVADQLHVWTQYQKNITASSDEAYVRFFFELDTNTNLYEDYGFYVTIEGLFENQKVSFYGAELDAIAGLQTPDVYDYSGKANKFVYSYFVLPNDMFGLDITVQAYFTDAAGEQLGEVKTANVADRYNLG